MHEVLSFRPLSDPTANWANRLVCAAKLALARTRLPEKIRRQRAIEILETAPENGFTSKAFNAVYHQLIPLYLSSGYFEEALLHPGFSRRHLETFKTAFERFILMFKVPPSLTVCFYLGVIRLACGERAKAEEQLLKAVGNGNPWNVPLGDILRRLRDGQADAAREMLGPHFKRLEEVFGQKTEVRPEIEEFLRFCAEHPSAKGFGQRRNPLFIRWLRNEIPAPGIDLPYPVSKKMGYGSFNLLNPPGNQIVIQSDEIKGSSAKVRTSDKAGRKIASVYDSSGEVFTSKYELIFDSEGRIEKVPLTPNPTRLVFERTAVTLDWLEDRGDPPPYFFFYTVDSARTITLFQVGWHKTVIINFPPLTVSGSIIQKHKKYFEKTGDGYVFKKGVKREQIYATANPKLIALWEEAHQVAVKYENKDGKKIASVYRTDDLSRPISEHCLTKGRDGSYKTEPVVPSGLQFAFRRGKIIRKWLRNKIKDPDKSFDYYLGRAGYFNLATVGGKPIYVGGLSAFRLTVPFTKGDINGLENWFFSPARDPEHYYFKPGLTLSRIKRERNRRLLSLWRRACTVQVRLRTLTEKKYVIVSQKGSSLPHRFFNLTRQPDGTYLAEPRKLSRRQARNQLGEKVANYLLGKTPVPSDLFPYQVGAKGEIDLVRINGQPIRLTGLAEDLGIKHLNDEEAAALAERYPEIILGKAGDYRFSSSTTLEEVRATGDQELIRLWSKTHQALVSFREEKNGDGKRIIAGIHHSKTRRLAAQFELIPRPDKTYLVHRLKLSRVQSLRERGRQFFRWTLRKGPAPAGTYKYQHDKGQIILFYHGRKPLAIPVGTFDLDKIDFRVRASEEKGRKYVKANYNYGAQKFARTFEILGDKAAGLRVEETPESKAVIEALPKKIRRLFTRAVRQALRHSEDRDTAPQSSSSLFQSEAQSPPADAG